MNKLLEEKVVQYYIGQGYTSTEKGTESIEIDMCKIQIEDKFFDIPKDVYEDLLPVRAIIEKSDFKPLPYSAFRERILQLYSVDIDTMYAYYPNPDTDHPVDIIMHSGFMILTEGGLYSIDEKSLIHYNNMVLHDDSTAFAWMKVNAPYNIIRQVQELGVTSNERWLNYAFSNSDFFKTYVLHDYIFGMSPNDDKYHLRKEMLNLMIAKGVDLSLLSSVLESVERAPEMYSANTEELIGYLYTKIDEIGQSGYIEHRLDDDSGLIKKFKDNNYYGSSELKFFCEDVYETKAERKAKSKGSSLEREHGFKISDPDGFVNMRKEANVNSVIITAIPNNEFVAVLQTADECKKLNWWKVEYEGKTGYVHKSRIIVLSKNAYMFE